MGNQQCSVHLGAERMFLLAAVLAAPIQVCGAEPLETIREAFNGSLQGLTSGIGKGTYRHYRAVTWDDWQLKQDADFTTYFDGKKYHIELIYHSDDFEKVDSRRIIYDGEAVRVARFTPRIHPMGAEGEVFMPQGYGNGVSKPSLAFFPWDVAQLPLDVWYPDRQIQNATPQRFEIRQTAEGDLVGGHSLGNTDQVRVRFECPQRSGFNLSRMQVVNVGQTEPARDVRIEWKQSPSGLWYVRSIDEKRVLNRRDTVLRIREVMKYTEFLPNVNVDPKMFTEAALGLQSKSRIIDHRLGAKERIRRLP
jgi:hypothetical protein